MVDAAIESVTRTIVTGVLPGDARTHVRFGSPGHLFFPKASSFTQTVLDDYAGGSRFWVYAGHGQVTELDRVPQTDQGVPVLDSNSVKQLRSNHGHWPIALMLACYTGAMDAGEDSIAEQMWLHENGPIAVIAGCRVTMPYGNTTAAVGLIDAVYEQRKPRLGDAWLSSVQAMQQKQAAESSASGSTTRMMIDGLAMMVSPAGSDLVAERCEHSQLYNLIGDPTLTLAHPELISMEVEPGFDFGSPIAMNLQCPIDGQLTIVIDRPLGTSVAGDPNELTVATMTVNVAAGQTVRHEIVPPASAIGPMVVRAHVEGNQRWASAAAKTMVRQSP